WIYGCDVCQEVCPWNQKFSMVTNRKEFQSRKEILQFENVDWDDLDEDGFRKLFKGSAVKRIKYAGLKRNIEQKSRPK
ncbi:MAG: tRNA epoxyqueuosine(34) reductase QueG, partial [Candidatus Marinimicrobia bacterium]|nr:tRNA epoxyqueuosine(34) reductase QueG [Candidatus Neomarinimicrobiota bacterium]